MTMFDKYLAELNRLYRSGHATEHSYRPALQECLTSLLKDVQVTDAPNKSDWFQQAFANQNERKGAESEDGAIAANGNMRLTTCFKP